MLVWKNIMLAFLRKNFNFRFVMMLKTLNRIVFTVENIFLLDKIVNSTNGTKLTVKALTGNCLILSNSSRWNFIEKYEFRRFNMVFLIFY